MRQKEVVTKLLQSVTEVYYKVRQVLQSVTEVYHKVRQVLQSASGVTKCDRLLLQSASGITMCDSYYKVRRNTGEVVISKNNEFWFAFHSTFFGFEIVITGDGPGSKYKSQSLVHKSTQKQVIIMTKPAKSFQKLYIATSNCIFSLTKYLVSSNVDFKKAFVLDTSYQIIRKIELII